MQKKYMRILGGKYTRFVLGVLLVFVVAPYIFIVLFSSKVYFHNPRGAQAITFIFSVGDEDTKLRVLPGTTGIIYGPYFWKSDDKKSVSWGTTADQCYQGEIIPGAFDRIDLYTDQQGRLTKTKIHRSLFSRFLPPYLDMDLWSTTTSIHHAGRDGSWCDYHDI